MDLREDYQRFIAWQCRLRKLSMRELGGRPTPGMSAGVYSINGGDEQARIQFLIVKQDSRETTSAFQHLVRKSQDPADWAKNGLRILSEMYYQQCDNFSNQLTALFTIDSLVAEALLNVGVCRLCFAENSVEHGFDFDVKSLVEEDPAYQATYWHNRLFNATLPGTVQILGFEPRR